MRFGTARRGNLDGAVGAAGLLDGRGSRGRRGYEYGQEQEQTMAVHSGGGSRSANSNDRVRREPYGGPFGDAHGRNGAYGDGDT